MQTHSTPPKPPNTQQNAVSDAKSGGIWAASAMLDLLLPPACRLCGEPVDPRSDFCHSCNLALTLSNSVMRTACRRCGRPGGIAAMPITPTETLTDGEPDITKCVHCKKETFHFDQVVAKWTYQGRVCDAIIAAKYAQQSALGNALGRQLGQRVVQATAADLPGVITYVPSNFRRQWARGGRSGNLAVAQAVNRCLAKTCERIVLKPLLRTTRHIKKQAWLSDVERRKNVSGAFATKKSYAWPRDFQILGALAMGNNPIKDQHILVVDDVLTTGATANEVAKVLREAGARRVTLAVVARAVWSK